MSETKKSYIVYQDTEDGIVSDTVYEKWADAEKEIKRIKGTNRSFGTPDEAADYLKFLQKVGPGKKWPYDFHESSLDLLLPRSNRPKFVAFTDAGCEPNPGLATFTALIFEFANQDKFYGSAYPDRQKKLYKEYSVDSAGPNAIAFSQLFSNIFQLNAAITGWENSSTNNRGELSAVIACINWFTARDISPDEAMICSDSKYAVCSLTGQHPVGAERTKEVIRTNMCGTLWTEVGKEIRVSKNPWKVSHVSSLHTGSKIGKNGPFHLFNVLCDIFADMSHHYGPRDTGWFCVEPKRAENQSLSGHSLCPKVADFVQRTAK